MKKIKAKPLFITCLFCLMPVLLGLGLYNSLPDKIAIHFDLYNNPDNYGSKALFVFGFPAFMTALQAFICILGDVTNSYGNKRIEAVYKAIIPIVNLVVYVCTMLFALGKNVDISQIAVFLSGLMLVAMGNYMPKFDYVNWFNEKIEGHKAKKINRILGYMAVALGVVIMAAMFLPPLFKVGALLLMIPYGVFALIITYKIKKSV